MEENNSGAAVSHTYNGGDLAGKTGRSESMTATNGSGAAITQVCERGFALFMKWKSGSAVVGETRLGLPTRIRRIHVGELGEAVCLRDAYE